MEQDSVDQATDQMEGMECEEEDMISEIEDQMELNRLEMEEKQDIVGEMPSELWNQIRDQQKNEPSMFVSQWEEDEQGIIPGDQSDPGEQFLKAAEQGDIEILKQMYARNPMLLSARDRDNYTPLHRAAYNNHIEACKWLLSIGADPELRTESGWTVLHSASCWAAHDIVGLLLSYGVDVNSHSNGDVTPLHLAISSAAADPQSQLITIKYLLSAPGIDMSALNKAGETPLMLARRTSPKILELVEHFLRRP